jgi:hypothetical protein
MKKRQFLTAAALAGGVLPAIAHGASARARRFIVATHLDGEAMALGGLGPLWAVYDADRVPDMAARRWPSASRCARGPCTTSTCRLDLAPSWGFS